MSGNSKDFKVKNGIQPTVYHEGVGTVVSGSVGYDLAGASYDSVSFSLSGQDTLPVAFAMKNDGTVLYMHGATNDRLYQYTLSTAWDLSTASYASKSFLTSTQNGNAGPVAFKADGTSFYVSGSTNDTVYQYDMSTAWDISTASYASKSFSLSGQETVPTGLFFKSDGTKMYMVGSGTDSIYQYSLSTAWDVSTASYDSVTFDLSSQGTATTSLFFKSDGTEFYTTDSNGVFKYSLSTAWDISTTSYVETFNTTTESTSPYQSWFKSDGTKMFVLGLTNDSIYQYSTVQTTNTLDLSTGSVFEVTPTSDIQVTLSNPADSGTVSGATLLLEGGISVAATSYDIANGSFDSKTFSLTSQDNNNRSVVVSDDGTKFFVMARNLDSVTEYTMSTAFDVSTASYDSSFSVSAQTVDQTGITMGDSGTKLYVIDNSTKDIEQYTMSTAFDISTASYASKNGSISSETTTPTGIVFKTDGTKLYIADTSGAIYQYSLSTAWDVSTISYDSKSFTTTSQDTLMYDVAFNDDGSKMFLLGTSTLDTVYQYSLPTAWDISTASYDSVSLDVSSQMTGGSGLAFGNNGTFLIIVDNGSDDVNQYTVGFPATPATITYPSTVEWPSGTAPTSPAVGDTDVLTISTTDGGTSYQAVQAIDGAR